MPIPSKGKYSFHPHRVSFYHKEADTKQINYVYVSWQQVPWSIKETENNGGCWVLFLHQVERKGLWAKATFEKDLEEMKKHVPPSPIDGKKKTEGGFRFLACARTELRALHHS